MRHSATIAWIIVACLERSSASEGPCDRPPISTGRWPQDGGSRFDLHLAPGLKRTKLKGFDSEVAGWASARSELAFDFGAYSNPLDDSLHNAGTICHTAIGGRSVRIVIYLDSSGRFAVGAHWPRLASSSLGPVALTISGRAVDAAARDSLLAALWTVTFKGLEPMQHNGR